MYHEKASYVKCASTFLHHKFTWQRDKKAYACIDLFFQESNSKTKLEVDVFRIMPMTNHGKWDQKEAEKASRL